MVTVQNMNIIVLDAVLRWNLDCIEMKIFTVNDYKNNHLKQEN